MLTSSASSATPGEVCRFEKEPLHSATASINRFADKVTANRGWRKRMRAIFLKEISYSPVFIQKYRLCLLVFLPAGPFHIGTSLERRQERGWWVGESVETCQQR